MYLVKVSIVNEETFGVWDMQRSDMQSVVYCRWIVVCRLCNREG